MTSPLKQVTRNSPRAVLALTGTALFMIVLDNLIVASALPSIERSLNSPLSSAEWILYAYILSFAVLILTGAALGERFGRRRVFIAGLVIFTAASAAGALAANVGQLVAARAVQGAGSAILMPLTLTLLTNAFPAEKRGTALGIWSSIAGLGVAAGPVVGGLVTDALSWHWIFWINVPVGVAAILLSPRLLEESRGRREPIDLTGLALVSAGLLGVVYATVRGNDAGWLSASTVSAYVLGTLLLIAFVTFELRKEHPMLPMRLFRSARFSISNATGFLLHFAMFGAFLMVIQFLVEVRGESPVMSGVCRHGAPRSRHAGAGHQARRLHHPARDDARDGGDRRRHRAHAAEPRRAGHGLGPGCRHRQGLGHAQHRTPGRQRGGRGRGGGNPPGERTGCLARRHRKRHQPRVCRGKRRRDRRLPPLAGDRAAGRGGDRHVAPASGRGRRGRGLPVLKRRARGQVAGRARNGAAGMGAGAGQVEPLDPAEAARLEALLE